MTLDRATNKAEGLDRLKRHLLAGRRTPGELQTTLGIDRSTLWRWRQSLEMAGYIIEKDQHGRLFIDQNTCPTYLKLAPQESVMLMLALRLFQQYSDKPNRYAVELLHKLGAQLQQGVAPVIGSYVVAMADYQRHALSQQRSNYERIMESVATAWLQNRKLDIRYRPMRAHRPFDEVFHPYMLEPSAIGRGTYIIGYSELVHDLRVRKVERIQRIPILLDESFTIPETFDVQRLLSGAWGIWFDVDEQPTTVTLRFSTYVAERVMETRWHPSERKVQDADGRIIWTAEIDAVEEMLPWIRGWGADCEVLEPAEIRDKMVANLRRLARLYGMHIGSAPTDGPDLDLLGSLFKE